MFSKNKSSSWTSSAKVFKTKNPHSLEHLKYLYNILCKNNQVNENNLSLLVETLRAISEILIWGDQNDSSVFDFFLEKNMLVFFLNFMSQKSGQSICVQLLQTLNILFDNISNETSVYYLLSNNHINSIIIHKFDFSDEEVMAYYISFLKTLSMRLNKHTIHFFYNEHTNDFALYTEAIKFFNNPESMVRIAVRTITLNVYKACKPTNTPENTSNAVDDGSLLRYIRDKTASPYFSNLVWFIGNHVLEINNCLKNDNDHNSRSKLADLVAEHLDHLHYLNDILCLQIDVLNDVLSQQLMNRLILPLYVASLITPDSSLMSNCSYVVQAESESSAVLANSRSLTEQIGNFTALTSVSSTSINENKNPKVDQVVALFLLSQVFLIIHHAPLVHELADIIFNADVKVLEDSKTSPKKCAFAAPTKSLIQSLEDGLDPENRFEPLRSSESSSLVDSRISSDIQNAIIAQSQYGLPVVDNSTDEEKLLRSFNQLPTSIDFQTADDLHLDMRPFLAIIFASLDCNPDDYKSLFSLCLLHAITHNPGVNVSQLASIHIPSTNSMVKHHYNSFLVQKLVNVMSLCCQNGSKVRLVTLELSICLLKLVAYKEGKCFLQDGHLAAVESVREESNLLLRSFYKVWEKCEEIFLDMFEDEYRDLLNRPLNVEYLMMDSSVLLPPTVTPLTGIEFSKRLPCGEVERARKAIRVFFLMRRLSFHLRNETETDLPLTKDNECVRMDNVLDLNNSDLIACMIISNDGKRERRFLVINVIQMILVEPDSRRLGWGVVRFVGFLQDVDVMSDKEDSRCLHVTIHRPNSSPSHSSQAKPQPLLSAKFLFDDHIRCMAARQRLTKGRLKARQKKMQMIAHLLDLPTHSLEPVPRVNVSQDPNLPGHHRPGQAQRKGKNIIYNASSLTTTSPVYENSSISLDQSNSISLMREHEKRSRKMRMKLNETLLKQDKMMNEPPSCVIMAETNALVLSTLDAVADHRSKYLLARSEIDTKKKKVPTATLR